MKNVRKLFAALLSVMMLAALTILPASAKDDSKTINVGDNITITTSDTYGASINIKLSDYNIKAYSFKTYTDLSYGKKAKNKYDLYIPSNVLKAKKGPLIVLIHGGAYNSGSKDDEASIGYLYAAAGYMVANIDYTPTAKYNGVDLLDMNKELFQGVKAAKKKLTKLGISCNEMATFGYSAGGGLALTYAYTHAKDSAIPVKFVSAGSAPADFTSDAWMNGLYVKNKREAAEFVSGDKYTDAEVGPGTKGEKLLKRMSPITYLKKNSVPTLLLYGEQDYLVPTGQHKAFLKKLNKLGVYNEVYLNPVGGHLSLVSVQGVQWLLRTLDWCNMFFTN